MSKDTGGPQVKLNPDKGKSPKQLAWECGYVQGFANAKALYALQVHAAGQRQPLTWEQIESIRAQVLTQALQLRDGCDDQTWDHWFACAIEAAHGIGATTEKEPNK